MTEPDPTPSDASLPSRTGVEDAGYPTDSWRTYSADPNLRTPPLPGSPGNRPPDEDLDLNIGWDRFEKLLLAVVRGALGLRGIKFRRYGVPGQAQHGIDLAGRETDGRYIVIQCKDYENFAAGDLRAAVEKFAQGKRPFDAYRLIIATSASTQATQLADELGKLQDEHPDLELDLWGAEQINDHLRYQGDVVSRFWTRETAETFCTGAPLPGVPAPLPDRQEQAERILVGPLMTGDVMPILREADTKRAGEPAESARLYGDLAARLDEANFKGHAIVLRNRQLDALKEAGLVDEAAALAAHMAAIALYYGDRFEPRKLAHLLRDLVTDNVSTKEGFTEAIRPHMQLIGAAVDFDFHPLGESDALENLLTREIADVPQYQPLLVLLLVEYLLATEPKRLPALNELIAGAISRWEAEPIVGVRDEIAIRLRLVQADYDEDERRRLLQAARRHRVPGRYAALISAREARRCCLEGRAEEALECWRDAVHEAIHAGLADAAADWLYAIRALNVQYGPWASDLDEEHRLAQALRATGSGQLLDRAYGPRERAMAALVGKKPIEAVLAARRWLTDGVITGSWVDEAEALEFLGDLYRDNSEPARAAMYYQRAGKAKALEELAGAVGDMLLPVGPLKDAPWWVLHARAALISAQADLLDDGSAAVHLEELTDLATRGRAGELTDSPTSALTLQATRSMCILASRGTPAQAAAVLDLLAPDVPREPNHYRHTDDQHAIACVEIARAHPSLAMAALTRLFDLAAYDTHKALELVTNETVLGFLGKRRQQDDHLDKAGGQRPLTADQEVALRSRALQIAEDGRYLANVVGRYFEPNHPSVRERAEQARDRILHRPDPQPGQAAIGTMLVTDSYLASSLSTEDQRACLEKLLDIAGDPREVASNRQDALIGATNFLIELPVEDKQNTFPKSVAFVRGEYVGSHLDEFAINPHPLSSFKINLGSASLRGPGLRLAMISATTPADQEWVRDRAVALLSSEDIQEINAAAVALSQLPESITWDIDVNLLAAHGNVNIRQVSAVLCMRQPERYRDTAMRLSQDGDFRVRRTLAEAATNAPSGRSTTTILETLAKDPRHSVRTWVRSADAGQR